MSTQEKKYTFSRRNFLRTAALAGGGVMIGFNMFTACKPNVKPSIDVENLNFNDFNAFIKISQEGYVTIYSPNPEIGQGVKTSMPMIIAEELDVDWDKVHVVQAKYNKKEYTRQVAGGSQSIRHGWDALRQTGATTKQMLVNAAAAKWGVEASTCKASKGVITNAKGETLGYGDVVKEAALLEVPEKVTLKKSSEYTIIGTNAVNVDLEKIVTGKPLFGLDYKAEGMLYASVLRPPAFGQILEAFDDSDAKKVNGVSEIIKFGDKIAVLGSSTWAAMKGKKALKATWKEGSKLESTSDHNKILNEILDAKDLDVRREDGNVKQAFKEADKIIEKTYHSPFLPHNCLEPMNFYANVTSEKIHLVGPIQTPQWTAGRIAKLLNRKEEEIELEMTRMGGGFGRRLYGDFALEAAEISDKSKKPVKVVFSREDDMTDGIYRPAIKYRIAASIKDGKITGYHLKEAAINGNMYGLIPHFFPAGCIPNYKVSTKNYKSNITTGAWRAPYTNFLAFAEQSFFDELALELNKDAVQLRLELLENVKGTKDEKIEYSGERMQNTIKLAAEKGNWGNPREGVYQGFAAYYSHNTHVAELAEVELKNGSPIVTKVIAAVDCGIVINPTGAINQIQGGVLDGLGHAMYGDLTFDNGKPSNKNFDTYRLIRMNETPEVEVHFVENELSPTGLGEPGLPPAGGAVANAVYKAIGKRMYSQPFEKELAVKIES
ncbi:MULTISPECIES: xanthine dehydrogenase family protein molybdopterin-binding subunit [unclassified Tenacibaculum]|uniref:xanthine dehydrogenase family protein molybdopterin-binding subunit n=1 Tax=unclassified Tenacibaculum TaxID=2635139 RepID=UPI001F3862B6|nr:MULTISPECIES: molybdopterin cofactor-binding domain-containing protein [unclassified Tenacibaculum]MCF2873066.1 molybdopterin-dependent oxidoreductase [Tenacibaculum sp. Cn5-1]MCF2933222.1 molybdopterin-dependent oxidoreductase [Tenacibaculum sp. Cn5-34]MCG7510197.1 molybdopterin-dependent oxidoreductase [Tenacibaculum sp. Cn5-46]